MKICPFMSKMLNMEQIDKYGTEYRQPEFCSCECQKEKCMAWTSTYPSGAPHLEGGYCKLIGDKEAK